MDKKALVQKHRGAVKFLCGLYNLGSRLLIRSKGNNNRVEAPCALLKSTRIRFHGSGNTVRVGDFSQLDHVEIYIHGDNNTVEIGSWCHLLNTEFCEEDGANRISIGDGTKILGKTHFAAIETTALTVGKNCLFSGDIHFRTGDSHAVLDLQGRRINPSRDITLGDHVWVGTKTTFLKGAQVGSDSVVGACAVVTGAHPETNCVLAGVPAKVVKRDVNWDVNRRIAPAAEREEAAL